MANASYFLSRMQQTTCLPLLCRRHCQKSAVNKRLIFFNHKPTYVKKIEIFLASSSELKPEREQFEIEINRKNKDWVQ